MTIDFSKIRLEKIFIEILLELLNNMSVFIFGLSYQLRHTFTTE